MQMGVVGGALRGIGSGHGDKTALSGQRDGGAGRVRGTETSSYGPGRFRSLRGGAAARRPATVGV